MVRYCAESAGSLDRAHATRIVVALVGATIVAVVRPWAGRHVSLGGLARTTVAALLAFVVTDGVLRIVKPRAPNDAEDPRRSKEPPPRSTKVKETSGRAITYAIDSEGRRARTIDDTIDVTKPTLVMIGESVAFGHGLEFDETIQAQLAKRTGLQVVNLAVDALANDEALVRLKSRLPRLDHPIAVISFVVYTWLERNVADYRPRLALRGDGSLVEIPKQHWLVRGSPLFPRLKWLLWYHHNDEAVGLTQAILRDTAEYVRGRGAVPLMVFTECGGDRCLRTTNGKPYVLDQLTSNAPFAHVDVDLDPKLTLVGDPHPTPEGALVYVDAIEKALQARSVLP